MKNNNCETRDWEDSTVFSRNQVEPHTTLIPFKTKKQALELDRQESPSYFTLNGSWKFNWSQNPAQSPDDFYKLDYNVSDWEEIKVPSNWQLEDFGHPMFRNVAHTFQSDPPEVPDDYNPVGSYVRSFNLPENWADKQIFLHFEGVKSASYVWINGKKVGYNQGGMEPAEYEITDYLVAGKNKIAVKVFRYSDGTYLECQES